MGAKAASVVAHSITANGLGATLSGIAATGTVAGTIVWTSEKVKLLGLGLEALSEGNIEIAASCLARLAACINVDIEMLSDVVEELLVNNGLSPSDAHAIGQAIANIEDEIIKQIKQ